MDKNSSERLSMRKSVLVWVGGICLGWGIASGLIFTYWAVSRQDPIQDVGQQVAKSESEARGLNEVMPASGADHK
jgi:hypothetical protein